MASDIPTARTIAEQVVATLLVWIGHATTQEAIAHVEPVIAKALTAAHAEAEASAETYRQAAELNRQAWETATAERDAARAELAEEVRFVRELQRRLDTSQSRAQTWQAAIFDRIEKREASAKAEGAREALEAAIALAEAEDDGEHGLTRLAAKLRARAQEGR